ncbi:hypothetical protein SKAU_G00200370 [Synaphobranchus kaupii]|uniref:Uncharacterized protein n=1 Tax=Synaphobranchus kaupii TaxID=118154 RepID=A0A9Q1FFD5_SYNKA|nr:hypothetical protein SKAU_G00200370 [Synaphobranchus kaupii]
MHVGPKTGLAVVEEPRIHAAKLDNSKIAVWTGDRRGPLSQNRIETQGSRHIKTNKACPLMQRSNNEPIMQGRRWKGATRCKHRQEVSPNPCGQSHWQKFVNSSLTVVEQMKQQPRSNTAPQQMP